LKPWAARLITYGISGGLAALAIAFMRPLPERKPLADVAGLAASWEERVDSIANGETLGKVLERGGVSGQNMLQVLDAASSTKAINPNRVRRGMRISFGALRDDSMPRQVSFHVDVDRVLRLVRGDSGWTARLDSIPWTTDTLVVRGQITDNLYEGIDAAETDLPPGSRRELAWSVANIFEFRIDMSRDVQEGDAFTVLVERRQLPSGVTRMGEVLAATFTNGGAPAASREWVKFSRQRSRTAAPRSKRFVISRTASRSTTTSRGSHSRPTSSSHHWSSAASRVDSVAGAIRYSGFSGAIKAPTTRQARAPRCAPSVMVS